MNRFRFALSMLVLTLLGTVASAQCLVRSRAVAAAAVVAPAVVTPAVTVLPAYGASYDNSAVELAKVKEQLAAAEARLALLESARDTHNARLAVLEARSGVAPQTPATAPTMPKTDAKAAPAAIPGLPAAMARSCVQCHQAGRNPKGGLALVDASGKGMVPLTCEQRLEVLRRVNLADDSPDVMPPRGKGEPVNDKEASELMEVLTKLKK